MSTPSKAFKDLMIDNPNKAEYVKYLEGLIAEATLHHNYNRTYYYQQLIEALKGK